MTQSWKPALACASLTALTLFGAACGDTAAEPPTPADLRARLRADLGHILDETAAAAEVGKTALPDATVLELLTSTLPAQGTLTTARVRDGIARLLPADPADGDPLDSDAAIDWLEQHLFTDANHLGGGVYQVPAELVCSESSVDPTTGEPTEMLDAACAADFSQVQLRIRVTADDDALDFAVQLGADHVEPILVGLSHTRVALSLDLDAAMAAAAQLAPLFGADLPNLDLAGQVTGALEVLGEDHVRGTLAIDRALRIRFADPGQALDGPEAFRFGTAATELLAIEYDAPAATGSVAFALGETSAYEPEEQLALDLPALAATATITAGQPLRITGITLGNRTTTLRKAGALAIAVDLNPADGRTLAATLAADGADAATLTVTPRLELRLTVDHAALGTTRVVYDVTRVLVDGTLRGVEASNQLEVVDGTLAVTTNPGAYGVTATAGQCVRADEAYDDASDAYYTAWSAGTCE